MRNNPMSVWLLLIPLLKSVNLRSVLTDRWVYSFFGGASHPLAKHMTTERVGQLSAANQVTYFPSQRIVSLDAA